MANQPDTAETIAARKKQIRAGEMAHADTLAKFGDVTVENVGEAIKFQEDRIKFYMMTRQKG